MNRSVGWSIDDRSIDQSINQTVTGHGKF